MQRIIALFLLFISFDVDAQNTYRINTYEFTKINGAENIVTISMPFGKSSSLLVSGDTSLIRDAGDIIIDIVCTEFPSNLSLTKLNRGRIAEFYKLFPFIHPTQVLKVRILRQIDGSQKQKAQDMFHGLIIKFRPPQTKETMIQDVNKLEEILKNSDENITNTRIYDSLIYEKNKILKYETEFKKYSLPKPKTMTPEIIKEVYWIVDVSNHKDFIISRHDDSCFVTITPREALKRGYILKRNYNGWRINGTLRKEIGLKTYKLITVGICSIPYVTDSLEPKKDFSQLIIDSTSITEYSIRKENHPLPDSTILKIFKRNKWSNMDIVGDVTGSMYPYTAQLLLWLKLQSIDSLTTRYSFFNDGNNIPDKKKKLGKTGGVYTKNCTSFSEVLNLVKTTMLNGGGGDCPENNVEALIEAEKEYPESNFHVLVADNWALIKDISLANKLNKPVRIVLCGVSDGIINTQYLDLARLTKGSVHLIETDLFNLATLHEGETIVIGKREFKLSNGYFLDVTEKNLKTIL